MCVALIKNLNFGPYSSHVTNTCEVTIMLKVLVVGENFDEQGNFFFFFEKQ